MIAVVVTARPSWAKLEPICRALRAANKEFTIVACASALLERYGQVINLIKAQGYLVGAECWSVHEGENQLTTALETGALIGAVASALHRLHPSCMVVCADRHEVAGAAIAALSLSLPVVHLQGGERTGSIDNRIRNAVTMLSTVHCVATAHARDEVHRLVKDFTKIYLTGCPSIDLAKEVLTEPPVESAELGGTGAAIDLARPFVVCLQHPNTDEFGDAYGQMWSTMEALAAVNLPRIVFWPGEDAGAGAMSKAIREFLVEHPALSFHTVRSLPPLRFLKLLTQASCLVGNSSAGIRECAYLGVPVVNAGTRQQGRECAENVMHVGYDANQIRLAILAQAGQAYGRSLLYGDGTAAQKVVECLTQNRWC